MLERIVVWSLVKSGHKQMGNYFFVDGRFVHKNKIFWDFIWIFLLRLLFLGFGSLIYTMLWLFV